MCNGPRMLALLLSALISPAFGTQPVMAARGATQDITGIWQGKLKVDANTAVTVRFTFARKPDGGWSAMLNSPDSGAIKSVAADGVSLNDGAVKVDVAALSGSFSGSLKGRSIEGQWSQPGGALPLVLSPYEKPEVSKADREILSGSWHGSVKDAAGAFTFIVRFKPGEKGELEGSLAVLEQGGMQVPLSDIEFSNGTLSFKVPIVRGGYTGTYANGTFAGGWKEPENGNPGQGTPLALQKGEIAPPVYALKLSATAFTALSGDWAGTLQIATPQGQQISMPLVLHIKTNVNGDVVGFIDSPSQHVNGISVTEATSAAGKVALKVGALNAEYHADLSGNTLVGQWTLGTNTVPLTLKRQ